MFLYQVIDSNNLSFGISCLCLEILERKVEWFGGDLQFRIRIILEGFKKSFRSSDQSIIIRRRFFVIGRLFQDFWEYFIVLEVCNASKSLKRYQNSLFCGIFEVKDPHKNSSRVRSFENIWCQSMDHPKLIDTIGISG